MLSPAELQRELLVCRLEARAIVRGGHMDTDELHSMVARTVHARYRYAYDLTLPEAARVAAAYCRGYAHCNPEPAGLTPAELDAMLDVLRVFGQVWAAILPTLQQAFSVLAGAAQQALRDNPGLRSAFTLAAD